MSEVLLLITVGLVIMLCIAIIVHHAETRNTPATLKYDGDLVSVDKDAIVEASNKTLTAAMTGHMSVDRNEAYAQNSDTIAKVTADFNKKSRLPHHAKDWSRLALEEKLAIETQAKAEDAIDKLRIERDNARSLANFRQQQWDMTDEKLAKSLARREYLRDLLRDERKAHERAMKEKDAKLKWKSVENEGLRKTLSECQTIPPDVRLDMEVKRLNLVNETWKSRITHLEKTIAERSRKLDEQNAVISKLKEYLELFNEHHPRCECSCMDHRGLKRQYDAELAAPARGGTDNGVAIRAINASEDT